MVYSKSQAERLAARLGMPVEVGMTYGNPSVVSGFQALQKQGVEQVVILPLYPQYSGTTTGAVEDARDKALLMLDKQPSHHMVRDYHDNSGYIKALANKVRSHWQENGQSDYLLCSYHGIPQRYADNGDIYPQHCQQTTELLAQELGLDSSRIGMSYQSRFGKEEWVKPYTDETLKSLAQQNIASLDIITPAFSCDCLETLEEIAVECKEIFQQAGGKAFHYIPCLNDDDEHIEMMAELVLNHQGDILASQ